MDDFYVSCIKINGRPILPPVVLDERQRSELQGYRDLALQIELKIKERNLSLAVAVPEEPSVSTQYPVSPAPTDSTDLNLDLDTSSEAAFNSSFGRGLVRSESYTLDTPSQALLNSIAESDCEESETSTIKEKRRSSVPKFTCVRKKSAKVATVYSPKRRKQTIVRKEKTTETEETEENVIEADLMENMIKSMREEYELKLEMLRQQQEEEKAKLREEFLSQQNILFEKLNISAPERPQSPPIKPEKSPAIVVSRGLAELTSTMSRLPLGALVRGYFVRRLHKTDRVETIKAEIKETLCLAVNLHEQPPPLSMADVELHGRLIQQLDQSLFQLHSLFFELSTSEQLKIISADRERMARGALSNRSSGSGRVSTATERRQEMRRRSQQENLTPRGRVESKDQRAQKKSSRSPRSILTESPGFDGGNLRQNKNVVPWR